VHIVVNDPKPCAFFSPPSDKTRQMVSWSVGFFFSFFRDGPAASWFLYVCPQHGTPTHSSYNPLLFALVFVRPFLILPTPPFFFIQPVSSLWVLFPFFVFRFFLFLDVFPIPFPSNGLPSPSSSFSNNALVEGRRVDFPLQTLFKAGRGGLLTPWAGDWFVRSRPFFYALLQVSQFFFFVGWRMPVDPFFSVFAVL